MSVPSIIKFMVEKHLGKIPLVVGEFAIHETHGKVLITDGQFWGEHGVSNFWYWRKLNKHNVPYGKIYSGYGKDLNSIKENV